MLIIILFFILCRAEIINRLIKQKCQKFTSFSFSVVDICFFLPFVMGDRIPLGARLFCLRGKQYEDFNLCWEIVMEMEIVVSCSPNLITTLIYSEEVFLRDIITSEPLSY